MTKKKKTASRWRFETVIASEAKQSYIDVKEIATSGLRPPRNDKTGNVIARLPKAAEAILH